MIIRSLFIVMMAILAMMTLFETTKQLFLPRVTIIVSHIITVVFSTLLGTVVAGYVLMQYKKINQRLSDQIIKSEQLSAELRNLNDVLELKVQERTQKLLKAQEDLVRKEKLAVLGQIAGSVGHELRNPLGVMNNAVYYLKTVLSDADETTKEYLGIIEDEIADSDRIVSDLLDSIRTKPPRPEIINAEDILKTSLRKCNIPDNIIVEINSGVSLSIFADPLQISQIFINLIKNAADAMPDGGKLDIEVQEDKDSKMIKFIFRDSGTSILPENMKNLFTPLFTTKSRGIGLGLVVIKNLTQANGGSVDVSSEPNKGTTFVITLPAADEGGR